MYGELRNVFFFFKFPRSKNTNASVSNEFQKWNEITTNTYTLQYSKKKMK